MDISLRKQNEVKIVDIKGVLDTGTSPVAEAFINELLEQDTPGMIINLRETEYLSSSGLRILLATAKKLWAVEGKLKICSPNKVVKDILDTSGFSMILEVRETEEEALNELLAF